MDTGLKSYPIVRCPDVIKVWTSNLKHQRCRRESIPEPLYCESNDQAEDTLIVWIYSTRVVFLFTIFILRLGNFCFQTLIHILKIIQSEERHSQNKHNHNFGVERVISTQTLKTLQHNAFQHGFYTCHVANDGYNQAMFVKQEWQQQVHISGNRMQQHLAYQYDLCFVAGVIISVLARSTAHPDTLQAMKTWAIKFHCIIRYEAMYC